MYNANTFKVNPFSQSQSIQSPSFTGLSNGMMTNATSMSQSVNMPGANTMNAGSFADASQKSTFQDVLGNMVQSTNTTMNAPDALMQRAMTTGDVDIHEVMIANAKADIAINIVSQVATKVLQAYDRVQQIQV